MTYTTVPRRRALGQMKLIPGQVNFMDSPRGRVTLEQAFVDNPGGWNPGFMGLGALGKGGGGGGGHGGGGHGGGGWHGGGGYHGGGHGGRGFGRRGRRGWGGGGYWGYGWPGYWDGYDYDDYAYLPPAMYTVRCDNGTSQPTVGFESAVAAAQRLATLGAACRIYTPDDQLVAVVQGGGVVTYAPRLNGMGDALTDLACDSTTFAANWKTRVNDTISSGGIAALIGGAAAGLIGGIMGRPILGTVIGAGAAWTAYAVWTAPLAAT